jgi:polyisoprenoid-binding protein YceI
MKAVVVKVTVIILVILVASVLVLPVMFSEYIVGTPLPPLQLPQPDAAATNADLPVLDGTWTAGSGSVAGFRVGESFLLQRGTIVGRTSAVTGSLIISNRAITSASFQVDLSKVVITINKQTNNLSRILDTVNYPYATFTLTNPIDITGALRGEQTISSGAIGSLTMNNITRPITLALAGHYNGSQLSAIGSTSILLSDWGIKSPLGIHKDADIEVLIILQKA